MRKIIAICVCMMMIVGAVIPSISSAEGELILRVAMQDDLKTTNPLILSDTWTWNVLQWLYDEPMYIDPENGELIPYIAVGSANTSTTIGHGQVDWSDCDVGVFEFTPQSEWGEEDPSSDIGEVIIFYDFTNVTWHNGTQMDIRDVMFSFHAAAQVPEWTSSMDCLKDNGGYAPTNFTTDSWLHIYKAWESGDSKQAALKFVLQKPYADFFTDTLSVMLLPYHVWGYTVSGQDVDGAKIWCDPGYVLGGGDAWDLANAKTYENANPVGSGPFEFDVWEKGKYSRITTWPDHFYKSGYAYNDHCLDSQGVTYARLPEIDAMQFKIYKTSEAAILALKNNDIDYIAWPVPPTFVQELSSEPGISLQFSPSPDLYYMGYNMRRESFGYNETQSYPYAPEDDLGKPLRQAIAHCIDKEQIVDRLLQGFGIEGDGPVSPYSNWYNGSLPQYSFDPAQAITILENAGYQKTDGPASTPGPGNWWLRPDGTPIGSSAGGVIEILTPPADYDPIRAQAGLMIVQQLVDIGINAQSVAMDFGSIVNRIEMRDYDMYILSWDIKSQPPRYLYDHYHSSGVNSGLNYPGYQNESYDDVIDNASMTGDGAERLQFVKDAQAAISYDLPVDVLYYRTNIEAYRSDNYVGWEVDEFGSVFNWQTILNLRLYSSMWLEADFVAPPSAVLSNSTNMITVLVEDQDLVPVEGAYVWFNASSGSLGVPDGITSSTGKFTFTFTAPYVPSSEANGTKVIIELEGATKEGYDPAPPKFTVITVYPESVAFLNPTLVIDPDHIDDYDGVTFGTTTAIVTVLDHNSDPVVNAEVALTASPAILQISPSSALTEPNGEAIFTITSTDLPNDDDEYDVFTIEAYAALAGYEDGEASASLWILDKDNNVPTPLSAIFGVGVNNLRNTSARVVWDTDAPGDSTVNYSTNPDLSTNTSVNDTAMTTSHAITLYGLTPETTYYFEVSSSDDDIWVTDNNGSNYYHFTTLLENPPVSTENWSMPLEIGAPILNCADAYEDNLMVYSKNDVSTHSNDCGDTWSATTEFSGRVDIFEDTVYRVNQSGSSILFSKSNDWGDIWTPTVNVFNLVGSNDGAYGINYYENKLFIYSHDTNAGDYSIKLSISEDDGATWCVPIIVDSGLSMGDPLANEMVFAGGKLYMTYYNANEPVVDYDDYQIILIESADMGLTWGNRQVLTTSGVWPLIQADDEALHITYIGIAGEGDFSLMHMSCLDGTTWSTPKSIGPMTDATDPIIHHALVADSGRVYASYLDYHDNPTDDDYILHITKSLDSGGNWVDMGDVTGSPNNAMYPALMISGGRLHFVWSDFGDSGWGDSENAVTMYRYILLENATGDDNGGDDTGDVTAPAVIDSTPEGSAVPVNSTITITFDDSMNQTSVQVAFSISPDIDGEFSWGGNGTILTFTPSSDLSMNTTYTVVLNGCLAGDLTGRTIGDNYSWAFTTWLDTDGDGIPDSEDSDDDGDGVPDGEDDFPLDDSENTDTDGDGIGDNADDDDDNDGVPDDEDDFPLDPEEDTDTDGDGIGDNADDDDDGDGFLDEWEEALGTDPSDPGDSPTDTDGDGIPDGDSTNSETWMDTDDDGDGFTDEEEIEARTDPKDATDFPREDDDDDGGTSSWLWMVLILVLVGALGTALLLKRSGGGTPEAGGTEPETVDSETPTTPEEIAAPQEVPPVEKPAPEPAPKDPPKMDKDEIIRKLEEAYKEGKITEEQYQINLKNFSE